MPGRWTALLPALAVVACTHSEPMSDPNAQSTAEAMDAADLDCERTETPLAFDEATPSGVTTEEAIGGHEGTYAGTLEFADAVTSAFTLDVSIDRDSIRLIDEVPLEPGASCEGPWVEATLTMNLASADGRLDEVWSRTETVDSVAQALTTYGEVDAADFAGSWPLDPDCFSITFAGMVDGDGPGAPAAYSGMIQEIVQRTENGPFEEPILATY